jgi:hypothetical protein
LWEQDKRAGNLTLTDRQFGQSFEREASLASPTNVERLQGRFFERLQWLSGGLKSRMGLVMWLACTA